VTFEACAGIVERGDPDRFLAVMAAPVAARRVLFPIYAFNVEVSRAPWVTEEPMIAEMRLQWWRDALEEIASGGTVRRHEVTLPLADVVDVDGARALDRLVAARRWDVYKDGFEDAEHFNEYLDATAGELMWQGARALGAVNREDVLRFGRAAGLARYLAAVGALEEKGRMPLLDGRESAIAELAQKALKDIARPVPNNAAFLEAWQAEPILRQIAKEPWRVAQGTVGLSPFRAKLRLLRWS
jgi:phytoene synthase